MKKDLRLSHNLHPLGIERKLVLRYCFEGDFVIKVFLLGLRPKASGLFDSCGQKLFKLNIAFFNPANIQFSIVFLP